VHHFTPALPQVSRAEHPAVAGARGPAYAVVLRIGSWSSATPAARQDREYARRLHLVGSRPHAGMAIHIGAARGSLYMGLRGTDYFMPLDLRFWNGPRARQQAANGPSHMDTVVRYLIEFLLIWTALTLAWTLTLMTVRIVRSAHKPEK
jgi:hypothetical protein